MLSATELRNNSCFLHNGEPYRVLQYKHTHISRRGADIKVKVKNLKSGVIKKFNFGSNDRFKEVGLIKKKMQYLYKEGEDLIFMNPQTFEQMSVAIRTFGKRVNFIQEGEEFELLFWENEVLDINLPSAVVLEVEKTNPGVKGNSATNIFKPAVLNNKLSIKVPLFINIGDKIKVDTRSGEYLERAKLKAK